MLKKDPLGLHNVDPVNEEDDVLDEDATATYPQHRGTTNTDDSIATKEDQVLEMLEIMSTRSKSRSSSNSHSRSSSTHSSLPVDSQNEQSYLAYTEPLPRLTSNKDGQGGKREFAVFDDLELEFDVCVFFS